MNPSQWSNFFSLHLLNINEIQAPACFVEFWDKCTFNGEKQCDWGYTWRRLGKICKNGIVNEPNRNERRNTYSSNGMRFLMVFAIFKSQFVLLESHIESKIWHLHICVAWNGILMGNSLFNLEKRNQELKRVRCLIVKICLTCFS